LAELRNLGGKMLRGPCQKLNPVPSFWIVEPDGDVVE
jgi:hypothetical protein